MASTAGAATVGRVATAAIDFGTSGTSAVVALSASRNDGLPARVALDGRGGDGTSGKSPTAVLLLAEAPHKFVAFGLDAFARYKDAKVKGESAKFLLFSEFKMELRPGATRFDRGDPNSFTVGASDRRDRYKLVIPVVATLRHAKNCILQQIKNMRGSEVEEAAVSWVLTVPAIWDDEARKFMRYAAEQAGIGEDGAASKDAAPSRLSLALEPEAAAIAAIPSVRKLGHRLAVGDKAMIVDAGGGTIDINVSEVVEVDEAAGTVSLSELTAPSGGPFGGTAVDREFTSLLSSCAGKKRIPPSAWLGETRRMFLAAKESFDFSLDAEVDAGTPRAAATYTVDITDVLEEWGYLDDVRESEFKAWKERVIVAAFRSGKVFFSQRRGCVSISMDAGVMTSFFAPVVEAVGACVRSSAARPETSGVKYVIMAGGFASSKSLRRHMLALFPTARGSPVIVVVDNPSAAIADGAVRYGLSSNAFIATRLVRYSFGVILAIPYDPRLHGLAEQVVFDAAKGPRARIVRRLAARGTRMTTLRLPQAHADAVTMRCYPQTVTDASIAFEFVRTSLDLPIPTDPERVVVPKDPPAGVAVPLTVAGLPQTVFVPRSCIIAKVSVPMPPGMKSTTDGECILQFHFGRTEIEAEVTVVKTGDVRRCTIKYLSDRPASVPGAVHATGDDDSDEEEQDIAAACTGHVALRVRVDGLPPAATEHDLLLLLIAKGAPGVRRVFVPRGPDGRSLPHATVLLHTAEDGAAVAAALDGEPVRGSTLRASIQGDDGVGGAAASLRGLSLRGGAGRSGT